MNDNSTLEEILSPFDIEDAGNFTEHEVSSALRKLVPKDSKEMAPEIMAEAMAFDFCENYRDDKTGWGTYFGPMYVSSNGDGTAMEAPSIKLVTPEMIKYWETRASKAKNPIIKARYAGLVFDFSKKITGEPPSFAIGKLYVESLVSIAEKKLYRYEYDGFIKLQRALSIAISYNSLELIERIKNATLKFDKEVSDDKKPGLWGHAFDLLVDNEKVNLDSKIEQELVDDLENKLTRTAENAEPSSSEAAAERLASYYERKGKTADVKRVLLKLGEAYAKAISSEASAMRASGWLEQLRRIYVQYGLKQEAEKILIQIRTLGDKVSAELKPIEFSQEFPAEKIKQYLNEILGGNLELIFQRIAATYIPNKEQIKQHIFDLSKQAPLQFIIGHQILDERGRAIASIGSLEKDPDGHLVRQVSQSLSISNFFMRLVLDEAIKRFDLKAENIIEFLSKSPVFSSDRISIIKRGIDFYFENDFVASIHILIPQIEDGLRNIVELAGGNVLKPARNGGFDLKLLDDLLRDSIVIEALGEDMILYFKVLLTDKRGWNMRHNVCHGLVGAHSFNQSAADRLIHVLLCLGLLRKKV
ncbi:MAG TPA: DUF4209 domain-containing protein [Bacteroidia bacterium]|jgi:hypothetical protein|nr:DUF4209 domain-containing protein [Bacteroidia bacterium]